MNTFNLHAKTPSETPAREITTPKHSYHEVPGLHHETKDVLKQLDSNIRLLEDLGGRLNFMLSEVRSLIRR